MKNRGLSKKGGLNRRTKNQLLLLLGFALFILVFYFITKGKLLRKSNIKSIAASMIFLILSGYGMIFIFGSGLIDLSIGANILLTGAVGAFAGNFVGGTFGVVVFLIVSILSAVILGQISVQSTLRLHIPAWIAGLGSGLILESLLNIWNQKLGLPRVSSSSALGALGKAPGMYILLGVSIVLAFFIYNRTTIGINLQAVGGNPGVSANMGINVQKTIIISTIIGGAFVGLASLFNIANTGFVNPQLNLGSMSTIFRVLAVVLLSDSLISIFTQPVAVIYSGSLIAVSLNVFVLLTGKTGTELNFFLGILVIAAGILSRIGYRGVVK